ncbi:MAG: hypothetical protein IPP08_00430 [Chlorobiota bacterium]|jgi:tetratricopeptide (TPR) repeat protein|nr:MAG: hypothetical protein IPP08_00430 [Chlorobiota bacterium]
MSDKKQKNNQESTNGLMDKLKNPKFLGIIGVILIILIGGFWYIKVNNSANNAEAQIALSRARVIYDKGEFLAAINGDSIVKYSKSEKPLGLKGVSEEFSSTDAGKIASLMLGNCYLGLSKLKEAKEAYEKASSSSSSIIRSGSYAGIAAILELEGKSVDAAEEYLKAVKEDKEELNASDYIFNAAKNYEKGGKKDEAINSYKEVVVKFENSNASAEAKMALAKLNITI